MAIIAVKCPRCDEAKVIKHGVSESGMQRYYCKNAECLARSFQLEHSCIGCQPGINEKIVEMTANASGIRDTFRVLEVCLKIMLETGKSSINNNLHLSLYAGGGLCVLLINLPDVFHNLVKSNTCQQFFVLGGAITLSDAKLPNEICRANRPHSLFNADIPALRTSAGCGN